MFVYYMTVWNYIVLADILANLVCNIVYILKYACVCAHQNCAEANRQYNN